MTDVPAVSIMYVWKTATVIMELATKWYVQAMQKEGVSKISLVAFKDNHIGNAFWQGIGWTEREDFNSYEFILNEENIIRFVK